MVLLRRVIGDALRARRQSQHRTLREVSTAANVSLGYLSEIERGQKEASSELLSAICAALGAQLSELLREASDTVALAEQMDNLVVVPEPVARPEGPATVPAVVVRAPHPVPGQPERDHAGEPSEAPDAVPARDAVPAPAATAPVPARTGVPARPNAGRAAPSRPAAPVRPAVPGRMVPRPAVPGRAASPRQQTGPVRPAADTPARAVSRDGQVSVTVLHGAPLKTTLRATRTQRLGGPGTRDVAYSR